MNKHAYLIMAHNEFGLLKKLLHVLDDERNDIYLHIDAKVKEVPWKEFKDMVCRGNLFFVPRMNVHWGHLNFVKCELNLLKHAIKREYSYFHLISGVDFPLKTQDEIHDFLEQNEKDYIAYHTEMTYGDNFLYKVKYYFPLIYWVGKGCDAPKTYKDKIIRKLGEWQYRLLQWQEKKGIDRTKKYKDMIFYKGCNWFTLTQETVKFLIKSEKRIYRMFSMTNAPDEIFLPTLIVNSPYAKNVVNSSFRHIDWVRGGPYEFQETDKDELEETKDFFVRKVSYERHPELVNWLEDRLEEKQYDDRQRPLVSVIIPVYNVEKYVEKCVVSVMKQDYEHLEIIIVDDGSTDGSAKIVDDLKKKDERITVIHQQNKGLAATRNRAMKEAKGSYFVFVDSDDWVEPDYVSHMLNKALRCNADLVCCGFCDEDEKGNITREVSFEKEDCFGVVSGVSAMKRLDNIFSQEYLLTVVPFNKLYKRELWENVEYPSLIHEDEYIIAFLLEKAKKVSSVEQVMYHYVKREQSITGKENQYDLKHLDVLDAFEKRIEICAKKEYKPFFENIVLCYFEMVTQLLLRYREKEFQDNDLNRIFRNKVKKIYFRYFSALSWYYKREYALLLLNPWRYREKVLSIMDKK